MPDIYEIQHGLIGRTAASMCRLVATNDADLELGIGCVIDSLYLTGAYVRCKVSRIGEDGNPRYVRMLTVRAGFD